MNLDERLKKIEALFEGARTDGERQAAGLAKQRVLDRLQVEMSDLAIEFTINRFHGFVTISKGAFSRFN